jgi:hypothetical protein
VLGEMPFSAHFAGQLVMCHVQERPLAHHLYQAIFQVARIASGESADLRWIAPLPPVVESIEWHRADELAGIRTLLLPLFDSDREGYVE